MKTLAYIIGSIGFLILIVFAFILVYNGLINPKYPFSLENSDHIGSFIGGAVGAFFSFGSFLLIIATLNIQKHEFDSSNSLIRIQQFESSFFQLLNFHRELKSSISTSVTSTTDRNEEIETEGISFFDDFCAIISFECEKRKTTQIGQQIKIYEEYYMIHVSDIGHYFRNLYHVVKYVDESGLIDNNKRQDYMRIIRSQLSNSELICLGYNGLTPLGSAFKILIEKYKLLKNINFELSLNKKLFTPRIYNAKLLSNSYHHLKLVYEKQEKEN